MTTDGYITFFRSIKDLIQNTIPYKEQPQTFYFKKFPDLSPIHVHLPQDLFQCAT